MRIEHPAQGQEPQLCALWRLAFGDEESDISLFFSTAYAPERCLAMFADSQAAAALYWLDVSCWGRKLAYLYAVATAPAFRRRGLCRRLMEQAHDLLTRRGYAAALLMPAGEGLRRMYAAMGYRDCSRVSEFSCAAGRPVPVRAVPVEEYARLRRSLLPEGGVIQEGVSLEYLAGFAGLYAGEGFLLAAVPEGGARRGIELLGNVNAAPGILAALGYGRGTFRTPGEDIPFAMFRPLEQDAQPPAYFGLAFD